MAQVGGGSRRGWHGGRRRYGNTTVPWRGNLARGRCWRHPQVGRTSKNQEGGKKGPEEAMNYFQSMTNPKTFAIKKYMFEILQQKYPDHEQIVERMANTILTERDFNEFNQLIAAI